MNNFRKLSNDARFVQLVVIRETMTWKRVTGHNFRNRMGVKDKENRTKRWPLLVFSTLWPEKKYHVRKSNIQERKRSHDVIIPLPAMKACLWLFISMSPTSIELFCIVIIALSSGFPKAPSPAYQRKRETDRQTESKLTAIVQKQKQKRQHTRNWIWSRFNQPQQSSIQIFVTFFLCESSTYILPWWRYKKATQPN